MLSLEDVQHLRKIAWLWGCHDTVVGMGGAGTDGDAWTTAFHLFRRELGMGTFQGRMSELARQGYTMLPQWVDPSAVWSTIASLVKAAGKLTTKSF